LYSFRCHHDAPFCADSIRYCSSSVLSSRLPSIKFLALLLVALSDILALGETLALATAGVGVLESQALLVLALREVSGLVGTVDVIRLDLASAMDNVVLGLLKGAVVRRTVSVARHDLFVVVKGLWCFGEIGVVVDECE
jgi:hypothetical protein